MTLIHPTVHLNGTSKEELLSGYLKARSALIAARAALAEAAPNGRDYYVQEPAAIVIAMRQHELRLIKIDDVIEELEELATKLVDTP
jgi:hypothetical protein